MPLDIFSKRKIIEENKPLIQIDFREKNSIVPSELVNLGCIIEFKHLEIGDYIAGQTIVERKTLSDLQSSVIDKRIFTQLEALKSQSLPLVIIEGSEGWKLHENALRGILLSIVNGKIPVICTKNEKDTAKYIILLSKQMGKSPFSSRPYKKISSQQQIAEYILEGIPGIGPVTAKKLLEKFHSIKNIIAAEEKELEQILGSKYKQFRESIN